ncbi:unnamed protein product, partial [Rotaria magnacalcarata]
SAQWYGPLQRPPHPEQYRIPMSQSLKKENISKKSRTNLLHKESTTSVNTTESFCMNRNDNCADKVKQTDIIHECQYLTIVSFEIFCHTNETYAFALDTDEICSIFCTKAYET